MQANSRLELAWYNPGTAYYSHCVSKSHKNDPGGWGRGCDADRTR
jgi:hypothetical protein